MRFSASPNSPIRTLAYVYMLLTIAIVGCLALLALGPIYEAPAALAVPLGFTLLMLPIHAAGYGFVAAIRARRRGASPPVIVRQSYYELASSTAINFGMLSILYWIFPGSSNLTIVLVSMLPQLVGLSIGLMLFIGFGTQRAIHVR